MRILVWLEKSEVRGGIEVFAERHVAQLRAEGHEVELLSRSPFPPLLGHRLWRLASLGGYVPNSSFPSFGLYTSAASEMPKRFLNVALQCSTLSDFGNVLSHASAFVRPVAPATNAAIVSSFIIFILLLSCPVELKKKSRTV